MTQVDLNRYTADRSSISQDNVPTATIFQMALAGLQSPKLLWLLASIVLLGTFSVGRAQNDYAAGHRSLPDAHNCYPYGEWWSDRIQRAIAGGTPVAIEQDLYWYQPKADIPGRSVVAHSPPLNGNEPGMEAYFFERIRPIVEAALRNPDHSQWPLITLNLDIKTQEVEHLRAIRALLYEHEKWLTTTPRTTNDETPHLLTVGPVLVLNGPSDTEEKVFHEEVPVGGKIVTFGAVHTNMSDITATPETIESDRETNYRRWWNNPWTVIEAGGQPQPGPWTLEKTERLNAFTTHAHKQGLWIRFYTLDGASTLDQSANGWAKIYNFPTLQGAIIRWVQAAVAGVDFIASDQYELEASIIRAVRNALPLSSR